MTGVQTPHKPSILVPYRGPDPSGQTLDVFVYLRPESNGVIAESVIINVVKACRATHPGIDLVYLANIPGAHIVEKRIVERHYAVRLFFAVHGGRPFSEDMRHQFECFYHQPFASHEVIGAFEALRRFRWTPEELFRLWVEENAVVRIAGQVIKRYRDVWIVNYDIPALLHKNNAQTDIAVMTFRTREGYPHFFELGQRIRERLVSEGVLSYGMPIARAAHISRSPFEQLLDARDYLLCGERSTGCVFASSFAQYLLARGVSEARITGLVEHPICRIDYGAGLPKEFNLLDLCEGFSYQDGLDILSRIGSQARYPLRIG